MHLSTRIYTNSGRIEYDFNPTTGVHTVWTEWGGTSRGEPEDVYEDLAQHGEHKDVGELMAWLRTL